MRRLRPLAAFFRRLTAGSCAVLVLALAVLAACPTLHAWLHGESHLNPDDGCAVVLFVHGLTPAAAALVALAVAAFVVAWKLSGPPSPLFAEPRFAVPPSCGPPA